MSNAIGGADKSAVPASTRRVGDGVERDELAEFVVEKVRLRKAPRHEHIEGVCTISGEYYARAEVVASIRRGAVWAVRVGSAERALRAISVCPHPGCGAVPYITTRNDMAVDESLESLPAC